MPNANVFDELEDEMKNFWTNKLGIAVCTTCVATFAFGCPPASGPGGSGADRAPVDHESVQQGIEDHTKAAVEALVDGITLLESSEMADEYGGAPPQEDCVVVEPDDDGDFDEPADEEYECQSSTTGPSSVEDEADELAEELKNRIFTEANVETEDGETVVYLLDGEVVCAEEDFVDDQGYGECVDEVDALEIRLQTVKYQSGLFEIDVLLGADEIHPATLAFSSTEVSGEFLFDNFEAAADHIGEATDAPTADLPETFAGTVKLGYYQQGSVDRFAVDILSDLEIEGDGMKLFAEGVGEVFGIGVDTADETFEVAVGFGELIAEGETGGATVAATPPAGDDYDEDGTDEAYDEPETVDPVDVGVELAGLTSTMTFDPDSDEIEWTDVGLGNGPAKFFVDGETVLDINLDAGVGGAFDALMQMQDNGLKYSVEPGVELEIGLMFHRVIDEFDDAEDWMLDDVLTIALDGDANPAILIGDTGLEVLRGELSLNSLTTGAGADVSAGQCLVDSQDEFDGAYSEDDASFHPFDEVEAGECQEEGGAIEDTGGL